MIKKTHSNRQQLLSYRYYTLNIIKISSILVKEKAAFRSGASSSMHVVVKTRYENLKVHIRGSKDHARRSSLSTIRPLLLLVLIGRYSTTVSSFSFHGNEPPSSSSAVQHSAIKRCMITFLYNDLHRRNTYRKKCPLFKSCRRTAPLSGERRIFVEEKKFCHERHV